MDGGTPKAGGGGGGSHFMAVDLDAVLDEFEFHQDEAEKGIQRREKEVAPHGGGGGGGASALTTSLATPFWGSSKKKGEDGDGGTTGLFSPIKEQVKDEDDDENPNYTPIIKSSSSSSKELNDDNIEATTSQEESSQLGARPKNIANLPDSTTQYTEDIPPDSPPPYSEVDPMKTKNEQQQQIEPKLNRPTSLNIPPKKDIAVVSVAADTTSIVAGTSETPQSSTQHQPQENSIDLTMDTTSSGVPPQRELDTISNASTLTATSVTSADRASTEDSSSLLDSAVVGPPGSTPANPTPHSNGLPELLQGLNEDQLMLGKVAPWWVPDSDAVGCMICEVKFTLTKRRHHCRACGKVVCAICCSDKYNLSYMSNKEARVCKPCKGILERLKRAQEISSTADAPSLVSESQQHLVSTISSSLETGGTMRPNPAHPASYCSTIPPLQQAAAAAAAAGVSGAEAAPPSVMVPVGVLKRFDSSSSPDHTRSTSRVPESKSVMFSDGIRPGGDLTELDGSPEHRPLTRRSGSSGRSGSRKSSRRAHVLSGTGPAGQSDIARSMLPLEGLPYVSAVGPVDENELAEKFVLGNTVSFSLNRNLRVYVKKLYHTPANSDVWNYRTHGLTSVGQDELIFLLVKRPDEILPPRDIFDHIQEIYENAGRSRPIGEMGHSVILSGKDFLGCNDFGGFLYIKHTFQCIKHLEVPDPPFLFGILITKWEVPWARVFPLRLMLRLGAESRYYPCPLWSIRDRDTVYKEIGNTIMKILSDFRNFTYSLPIIKGLMIHMEGKTTTVLLPKNRYKLIQRALQNSNDPVLALGANFSQQADSHFVAVQREEDEPPKNPMSSSDYETQAINILDRTRKITGASFVVFNGALKSTSGLTAKSSIVEDGIMVQVSQDNMMEIRKTLNAMGDYEIQCGKIGESPEEIVAIKWIAEDLTVNIGIKSPIDNAPMDGVTSVRIHKSPDVRGDGHCIRWTEIFFLSNEDPGSFIETDPSKIAKVIAKCVSKALVSHLKNLKKSQINVLGIRISISPENVGYEAGGNGEALSSEYMNSLDNELIPVLHSQSMTKTKLELIFHILDL